VTSQSEITFAEDARLFIIDDEGVVFSEGSQKMFALNTAATLIWCCIEEDKNITETALIVAEAARQSLETAESIVQNVIGDWRTLGLLAGTGDGRKSALKRLVKDEVRAELPHASDGEPSYLRTRLYRMLDSLIAISFGSTEEEAMVHPALAHLEIEGGGAADCEIGVAAFEDGFLVFENATPVEWCDRKNQLTSVIKGLLGASAINASRYFLNIHAGVVGDGESCLLLPAQAGSGKSTLTAALVAEGYQFFSDEYALLQHETLHVRSVPMAMCFKSSGWDVVAGVYPQIREVPTHQRFDDKIVRYLAPAPPNAENGFDRVLPASTIIFPKFDPDEATALMPVSKVEALHRLMEECLAIPDWIDQGQVAQLVNWIDGIDCATLTISSLEEAVRCARDFWHPAR
jgi:hypothetical protein